MVLFYLISNQLDTNADIRHDWTKIGKATLAVILTFKQQPESER